MPNTAALIPSIVAPSTIFTRDRPTPIVARSSIDAVADDAAGSDMTGSWCRCAAEHHLDPTTASAPNVLTERELADRLETFNTIPLLAHEEIIASMRSCGNWDTSSCCAIQRESLSTIAAIRRWRTSSNTGGTSHARNRPNVAKSRLGVSSPPVATTLVRSRRRSLATD
jgi:hypothetical protein